MKKSDQARKNEKITSTNKGMKIEFEIKMK
jgi:hypothetical protein